MPVTKHYINIDSADRNTAAYPTPSSYQITLPSRYRNIWEARLVNIGIPEFTPPRRNVFLKIDTLNQIDGTSNSSGVNFCFAKLPLSTIQSNVFYVDSMTQSLPPIILQNPIASMDKLNISITDSRGNIISILAGNDYSMQLELVCGDYINNGGGSTLTAHGRILGGSR
jgi:hypothetical protein